MVNMFNFLDQILEVFALLGPMLIKTASLSYYLAMVFGLRIFKNVSFDCKLFQTKKELLKLY